MDMDRYAQLRPPLPTPADEICTCDGAPPLKLMCALSYNPIHCLVCNLEVAPEGLELEPLLVEAVAFWRSVYDAIDRLWLDSGDYEDWAEQQLADITSPVNVHGREVQQHLNNIRRCYYWYFQDQSADDYTSITHCPACSQPLLDNTQGIFSQRLCESCSIVTVGE